MQANREELVERIARAVPEDVTVQPLKGLSLSLCDECQKRCSVLKNPREVDNPGTMHVPSSSFRRQFCLLKCSSDGKDLISSRKPLEPGFSTRCTGFGTPAVDAGGFAQLPQRK
jgi:hypothetical protein